MAAARVHEVVGDTIGSEELLECIIAFTQWSAEEGSDLSSVHADP